MPCACDFKCAAAAACFSACNVLLAVYGFLVTAANRSLAEARASGDEDAQGTTTGFDRWKELDPDPISDRWEVRGDLRALYATAALSGAVAWFWLMVPIIQSAWVLSRGGKRKVGAHALLAALAVCGGIVELLARLITVGMNNAFMWLARDFNLSNWEYDGDGTGWRVLEMIHVVTTGMTLWVDAFERAALFGIVVLLHYSVATEPAFRVRRNPDSKSEGGASVPSTSTIEAAETSDGEPATTRVPIKPTFSKRFTRFGLFLGVLCLIDFLSDVLRFVNWGVFGIVAGVSDLLLGFVFLPTWLLWLGCQLPEATARFERGERRDAILSRGEDVEMAAFKGEDGEFL